MFKGMRRNLKAQTSLSLEFVIPEIPGWAYAINFSADENTLYVS